MQLVPALLCSLLLLPLDMSGGSVHGQKQGCRQHQQPRPAVDCEHDVQIYGESRRWEESERESKNEQETSE